MLKGIKKKMLKFVGNSDTEDKNERLESYSIFGLFSGTVLFALGIGLNAFTTGSLSTIFAMLGAFIAFISSIVLVVSWIINEIFGS